MSITISGQNNNDKILASDGVLDQISGFNVVGVMTATTFDVTTKHTANHIDVGSTIQLGNAGIITATTLIGNVTGNVNSTSNLLLQISGSEKFRVGNGGQLGIGGANYGTSGQVLTSQGSSSAPTWTTISGTTINNNAANKVIMGSNTANTLEAVAKSTLFGNLNHGQNFLDDQNLIFGNVSDMILIHTSSGSRSRLRNTNDSGSLDLESTLTRFLNKDGSTEKLRIDSSGRVLVNTPNPINTSTSKFQIAATDANGSAILARFNASVYSSYLDFYKSRSNTLGTAYVVNDDDHLGSLRFYGADGSNSGYTTAAEIYGSCDGGSGASGDMPGRITFHTRPDGAGQSMQERLRIGSDGTVTVGDGNNLASNYIATMLIDGGDNSKLTMYSSTTGTGSVTFSDGSGSGATRRAGFIDFIHGSDTTNNQFGIGLADQNKVHIRVAGSNRGSLEVYGNFNESDTPAIEINDSGDVRKVFLTNSSGDFNAITRNGSQTKGQLKMFESGMLIHNMKNPDATSTLQTLRTGTDKVTSGSTYTSISPIQSYMQKGDPNNYGCFEEGNCELEVNGGGNDHYQPVAFVPRGYNLDTTSFGGQWAGEMWIHQTSSQNPTSYGYSGYNTWATMSFKCRWDCAHWNAKPSGFWVEHYINQGRGNIGKIDASDTQSQFVIYLLPGVYKMRWNCVRGMSVHRAVSDGAALVMRDGGSFVTYSTLAYSSRNTSFDSQISPGSASFAYCT